jgi:RNA polymerase sigma factor (TIGR02999 family)
MDNLTLLLNRISSGGMAAEELLPLVYQKLRKVAAAKMKGESAAQTLQATALVHVAWLHVGGEAHGWQSRWQFFSAAAEAMRRILIDRARRRQAQRHGGGPLLFGRAKHWMCMRRSMSLHVTIRRRRNWLSSAISSGFH